MNTKNILKTLALAMLLVPACNKNEIANDENTEKKGFALPVTVNVTREGDDTKATYNEGTGKLSFSAGDILYVSGWDEGDGGGGRFCGALNYVPATGKFSGTIYIQNEWTGTAEQLFVAATADNSQFAKRIFATLLPNGYEEHGFITISDKGTDYPYDDYVTTNDTYTLATSKAAGVEQLSYEESTEYSSGFALAPQNAILNFTVTGFTPNTDVNVVVERDSNWMHGTRTIRTDNSGNATFAGCYPMGNNLQDATVTVDGLPITLVNSTKNVEVGKIYNFTRVKPDGVVWKFSEMSGPVNLSDGYTYEGVTLQGNGSMDLARGEISVSSGNLTFTAPTGKVFKKIVINVEYGMADIMGVGWSENTWTGSSATVSFYYAMTDGITSIVFLTE